MTDDPHDTDLDDLASAHLDGVASPEEAARIAADPAAAARVEAFRAIQGEIRAVAPADADRRDAAISAAMAAVDDQPARVTSITAVAARRGPSPRAVRLLGAAAAVLLLAALVPIIALLGRSDDASTAGRADTSAETGDALGDQPGGAEALSPQAGASSTPEASTTTSVARPARLGAFDSLDDLLANATQTRGIDATSADGSGFAYEAASECAANRVESVLGDRGSVTSIQTAEVAGEPVLVVIATAADGAQTLVVVRVAGCVVLVERPVQP